MQYYTEKRLNILTLCVLQSANTFLMGHKYQQLTAYKQYVQ